MSLNLSMDKKTCTFWEVMTIHDQPVMILFIVPWSFQDLQFVLQLLYLYYMN